MYEEYFKSEILKQGKTIPLMAPKIEMISEANKATFEEMSKGLGADLN